MAVSLWLAGQGRDHVAILCVTEGGQILSRSSDVQAICDAPPTNVRSSQSQARRHTSCASPGNRKSLSDMDSTTPRVFLLRHGR
jgi:hypothetical protein